MISRQAHSVLVVDDSHSNRYSVARSLRASGYRTVEASAGAEALELAEYVSAVVLDVHLPDVDGLEVCRLLRSRRATAQLPIIHISAVRLEAADVQEAMESGSDRYFTAPVDTTVLTRAIDVLIGEKLQPRQTPAAPHRSEPGTRSGSGADSVLRDMQRHERMPDKDRKD
jgi:CheY-like chemotaxis protein